MATIRERSGSIDSDDPMVAFIYTLVRDHVPPSTVETIIKDIVKVSKDRYEFSNGWLAQYAKDITERLRQP